MTPPFAFIVLIESRRLQRSLVAALSATALMLSGLGLSIARAAPANS